MCLQPLISTDRDAIAGSIGMLEPHPHARLGQVGTQMALVGLDGTFKEQLLDP